ncbi:unnamed protein product [Cuscuta epithymum]|uniref:Uncharacterized protein n=1 Tax=Cuscuta epithymum TaxID=186058 RepID=A0AAV0EC03_9ASTE|nr:unnamed protein product [Cuscuta epithymum]
MNLRLASIPTTGKQPLLALKSFHLPSRQCPATQFCWIWHMISFSSLHLIVGLGKTKRAAVAPASLPDFGVEFAVSLCHPFSFWLGLSITTIIYVFMQARIFPFSNYTQAYSFVYFLFSLSPSIEVFVACFFKQDYCNSK